MIRNNIPKRLVYTNIQLASLRGPYVMIENFRENKFTLQALEKEFKKWNNVERFFELVEEEMKIYEEAANEVIARGTKETFDIVSILDKLREHPFWKGDEEYLAKDYLLLHIDFMTKMHNSKYSTSRNTCATKSGTCLTLLQRHRKTLYAVSRSCDISLGYLADLYTLYLYMKKYDLQELVWYINTPHVYVNNMEKTIVQYETKVKLRNMIFNKRK